MEEPSLTMAGAPPRWAVGTFEMDDERFVGLVHADGRVSRLSRLLPDAPPCSKGLLLDWAHWHERVAAVAHKAGGAIDSASLRVLPPVSHGHLFCAGANYREHVKQLAVAKYPNRILRPIVLQFVRRRLDAQERNGSPYVWLGLSTSMCGARDDVLIPENAERVDWELELAVIIGRRARRVSRDDALAYVAGYTVCNDVTLRDRVYRRDVPAIGTDWLWGKSAPSFFPIGPWMVPAEQIDPTALRLTLRLNGEVMQDESTTDMIFDVPRLIEHVSAIAELQPGDVLLTGSPAGNGEHYKRYLQPGDVLVGEITGLGRLVNHCVQDGGQS